MAFIKTLNPGWGDETGGVRSARSYANLLSQIMFATELPSPRWGLRTIAH